MKKIKKNIFPPAALAEVAEVAPEVASRGALMQSLNAVMMMIVMERVYQR